MPRKITAAQNHAWNFLKSDTLAQTNQIKYDSFFLHSTESIKNLFSQDLKLETKIPGTFFLDFVLFFTITVEKFGKKIIWSSWSSQKRFF